MNALDRLQRTLEALQKDAVERIVARLKDRMAIMLRDASKITSDLGKRTEDWEKALADSSEKSSATFEEACKQSEKQLEMAIHARLAAS